MATETFKFQRGLYPEIVQETFVSNTDLYNLCRNDTYERHQLHPVYRSTESLSVLGPKICYLIPVELKNSESLDSFKLKIEN